ncbi:MAG: hypothetical protein UT61_C0060G0003 [Candidatus Woesebacteria bacterium GW2011_GWA1_39_8]|uniref:Uncharacterized protein n=1 Tax=Candidatus Woesebacteria bacterium GW2011_GWA1_39_8 TaxID=1618552 RepID=A0A0G0RZY1_9BACT|nr:MAG: hypothetical protein UT61_C0060G0003 [Candidatus Woesebacteria bacterium GW2011_GWA1_39_8]
MSTNPFEKLIVEETQADNQMLADLLQHFVIFIKADKSMEFLPAFHKLSNDLRILVLLAASKAKASIFSQEENLSPKNIIDLEIAPEGSVKSSLKNLLDSKEIRSKMQKYYLPNYKISDLAEKLKQFKSK